MNLSDFTSRPIANTTYAKNQVPPFVIATSDTLYASLSINNEVVFEGTYVRNFDGNITIDFKGVYDRFLSTLMPNLAADSKILQTSMAKIFTAVVCPVGSNGTPNRLQGVTVSYRVANAKLNGRTVFGEWCKNNFLSNQPRERHTNEESPEWITYCPDDASSGGTVWRVVCDFYKKAGGKVTFNVDGSNSLSPFSVNVGFLRVLSMAGLHSSVLMGYYDIYVTKNNVEMCRQRYFYNYRTGREKYYCITNALGGIDTLICQGDNVLAPELNFNLGRINGQYVPLDDTDDLRQWRQNTGMIPVRQRNWVHELLTQRQAAVKYDPENHDYQDIVINMADITIGDTKQLASAEFGYLLQEPVNAVEVTEIKDKEFSQSSADKSESIPARMGAIEMEMLRRENKYVETEEETIPSPVFYVEFELDSESVSNTPIYYDIIVNGEVTTTGQFTPVAGQNKFTIYGEVDCDVIFRTAVNDYSYDGLIMRVWWY